MRRLRPRLPIFFDPSSLLPSDSGGGTIRLVFLGLCMVLLTALPASAHPNLELIIRGNLSDSQRKNISSYLSLARLGDDEQLSEAMFRRLYRKAPQEASKALEPFGYYAPKITLDQQRLQSGKWKVNLNVEPGKPIRIDSVEIILFGPGTQDGKLKQAIDQFPLHKGDILNHQIYEQGKERLITQALENGYQQAGYQRSRVEVNKKEFSAAIQLGLTSGARYLIGPLHFQADFIDHELLKKITPVHEGDPFSPKALTRMRQSLYNAGYFSSVDINYDLAQAQPSSNKVPLTVVLTPNLAHKYGIGLGYGTDTGLRSTLAYTNRHINRFGHQLDLQWQPSERKGNFGGVYTIPIGDPKRDRLSITGTYETESYDNTETETFNAIISHDHFRPWGEYSTYLQYLREDYDTGASSDNDQTSFIIPGIKGTIFWTDDRISTDRGLRLAASVIGSEKGVMGDADFIQASLHAKGIYRLFDTWRIIGRSEIGTTLVDDIYDLPPTLRFYAGGDQSVRGYGYKQIGPTDSDGNLLGGKDLFIYSVELERNLYEEWSGAVFYDSGTATNSFTDITMHSGAGVGLRWNGVFGQVRLDLAKALDEGGSWQIHFTLGADL
ncbi:MAG: autotransporter assembly complex protein TamA [Desulfobulbus sp.]|nr:autotransporter assembly complex protein TamA [Desulfobulbus sp.]